MNLLGKVAIGLGALTLIGVLLPDTPETATASKPAASQAAENYVHLSFPEKRAMLLQYRDPSMVCSSDSGNCMMWTNLMLHCERQSAGYKTDYSRPCSSAEEFREQVTKIELSTAPGAFVF